MGRLDGKTALVTGGAQGIVDKLLRFLGEHGAAPEEALDIIAADAAQSLKLLGLLDALGDD